MKQNTFQTRTRNSVKLAILFMSAVLLVQLLYADSVLAEGPHYQTRFTREGTFYLSVDLAATDDSGFEIPAADTSAAQVDAGLYHSAILYYDNTLYLWGDNTYGQLGVKDLDYSDSPVSVQLDEPVASMSLGAFHSLVLTRKGQVYAFGRNSFGQLGNQSIEPTDRPSKVEGLPEIAAVSAGAFHSMALGTDGSVWAWGNNTDLQIGLVPDQHIYDLNETLVGRRCLEPVKIIDDGIIAIAAGGHHSLALHESGQVYAWGANDRGQLGNGTTQSHGNPSLVAGLEHITQIAAGYQHNLAVAYRENSSDIIWTWGDDSFGQLGLGTDLQQSAYRSLPAASNWTAVFDQQPIPQTIVKIAAGAGHSAFTARVPQTQDNVQPDEPSAEHDDRELPSGSDRPDRHYLLLWGNNSDGQLGQHLSGNALNFPELYQYTYGDASSLNFIAFQDIALGGFHTILLSSKALAAASGRGDSGQLGTLSIIDRYAFAPVDMPDVIKPLFPADSYLQASWQENGQLLLRWPRAVDNVDPDVRYRLYTRTTEQDTPVLYEKDFNDLSKVVSHLPQDQPFEVILTAYDGAFAADDWTQLSRLVLYFIPNQHDRQSPETLFETVHQTNLNISGISFLQNSKDFLHHESDVPWDLTAVYGPYTIDDPSDMTALWLSAGLAAFLLVLSIAAALKKIKSIR